MLIQPSRTLTDLSVTVDWHEANPSIDRLVVSDEVAGNGRLSTVAKRAAILPVDGADGAALLLAKRLDDARRVHRVLVEHAILSLG